jgi:uncharacterized protein
VSKPENAVVATERAIALIETLKARFGPLMFVQSGGCCDGSSPVCLQEGDLLLGLEDLLIGEIATCPFYMDREQYERWGQPRFLIDCAPGGGDSFSIESMEGMHFIARTQSIVTPRLHLG